MSDTAGLNIANIQVYAEDQAEIDKSNGTFDANIASDPHYYLWQSEFQTVPMGVGDDPSAYVEVMLVAVPGINCVRIPFNENSFNEDGSLTPEMEGFLTALAENGIQIIPVLAVGAAQEASGTSEEIQAALAGETFESIENAWNLMLDWMEENPDVENAVYGYELLNEPAAFDQAINAAEPQDVDEVTEAMAALYVSQMLQLAEMISATSDAKIMVDAWGYAGQTDFLAETMVGDETAADLLEEGIGDDLVWSVHYYPGWSDTGDITDQADLEAELAEFLSPFEGVDVIITEINAPAPTTYNPYADDQVTTATALSLDFLVDSGVGIGWFPAMQTGSSGLALIESDGDVRYLNQPSLAAALDGFSRGDELNNSDTSELVELTLVEAKLRNQVEDPDYKDYTIDPVDFAGFGFGYAGNDTVVGSISANNFLYGGSGEDVVVGADHDDFLFGQDGNDSIESGLGIDHLIGGKGSDTLIAQGTYTVLYGEADSDLFVHGGSQEMTIADFSFEEGDKWRWDQSVMLTGHATAHLNDDGILDLELNFSDGTSLVLINQGEIEQLAQVFDGLSVEGLNGLVGAQDQQSKTAISMTGTSFGEVISGANGNDTVRGGGGNDLIYGESRRDVLFGDSGLDTLSGGGGNDSITSGSSGGLLFGGDGNDTLKGKNGIDTILGELGDDSARSGSGDDVLYGGDGHDSLYGGAGNDLLFGGVGNDKIFGAAGNDTLLGDAGDDTFNFSAGSDIIVGGEGLDTMQFVGTIPVSVDLARGTATNGAGDTTTFSEIENAAGGKSSDSILGNNFRNALSGNLGADLIQGLGGQDTIEGGQGADTLYGGSGDDYFVFSVDTSSASADDIVDFRSSDDSIHLVSAGNDQSRGLLDDASFLANSTGLASGIEDRVIFNTISGQVFYDCDGSGKKPAIELFSLNPSVDVTAADFTFF